MSIEERKERERKMRRKQIQSSAKKLFMTKGFASTTMDEIANEADLSLGTIYNYFKSKDELYASLILTGIQYLVDELNKIRTGNNLTTEQKYFAIKEALYIAYKKDPIILRNVVHMQAENTFMSISKGLSDEINRHARNAFNLMAGFYEDANHEGKLVGGNPKAHADILWGIFTGIIIFEESKKKFNSKKDFIKSTLDLAFDVFFKGIVKN